MTTDTRAALDAATARIADVWTSFMRARKVHPSAPIELADWMAPRELTAALDRAITAHVDAEVARRLAVAPSVEEAMYALVCVAFDNGVASTRDGPLPNEAGGRDARASLRAAIAADRERAIRDRDATWQAHDLERDAEVARWQGEAHALVRAIKSIAAAVGAPEVPSGDGWAERVAMVVIGKAARPTPDEARRLVMEYANAVNCNWATDDHPWSARTALLRALGVEA